MTGIAIHLRKAEVEEMGKQKVDTSSSAQDGISSGDARCERKVTNTSKGIR